MSRPPDPAPLHVSRSAERALSLLDTVISSGRITLGDAATATALPASTALRHLRGLVQAGYLRRDDAGTYSVGPTFVRLALTALRSGPYAQLLAAAEPELAQLAATTEESAYLAVRDGATAVYVATAESSRAIRHVGWVGRSVPIVGTAVGAALSAPPLPPTSLPAVEHNIGAIEEDVAAVSAAIHGPNGPVAALSVLGPADRLSGARSEDAGAAVALAATSIAAQLAGEISPAGS